MNELYAAFMNELCTGCYWQLHSVQGVNCAVQRYNKKNNICPCANCLIKVMCKIKCKDRHNYFRGISDHWSQNPETLTSRARTLGELC